MFRVVSQLDERMIGIGYDMGEGDVVAIEQILFVDGEWKSKVIHLARCEVEWILALVEDWRKSK